MEKYIACIFITATLTSLIWHYIFSTKKLLWEIENRSVSRKLRDLTFDYEELVGKYNVLFAYFTKTTAPKSGGVNSKLDEAYKVLGLDTRASMQEVKNKYRALIKKYHPDVAKSGDSKKFRQLNDAYSFIKSKMPQ